MLFFTRLRLRVKTNVKCQSVIVFSPNFFKPNDTRIWRRIYLRNDHIFTYLPRRTLRLLSDSFGALMRMHMSCQYSESKIMRRCHSLCLERQRSVDHLPKLVYCRLLSTSLQMSHDWRRMPSNNQSLELNYRHSHNERTCPRSSVFWGFYILKQSWTFRWRAHQGLNPPIREEFEAKINDSRIGFESHLKYFKPF